MKINNMFFFFNTAWPVQVYKPLGIVYSISRATHDQLYRHAAWLMLATPNAVLITTLCLTHQMISLSHDHHPQQTQCLVL